MNNEQIKPELLKENVFYYTTFIDSENITRSANILYNNNVVSVIFHVLDKSKDTKELIANYNIKDIKNNLLFSDVRNNILHSFSVYDNKLICIATADVITQQIEKTYYLINKETDYKTELTNRLNKQAEKQKDLNVNKIVDDLNV